MPWFFRLLRGLEYTLYAIFFASILGGSTWLESTDPTEKVRQYTRAYEFDYVSWTMDAVGIKLGQGVLGTPYYFNESSRHQVVVEYLRLMEDILSRENKLNLLYSDPQVTDPITASASLRSDLATLYSRQKQLAPLAEAILQEQVSLVLSHLGLAPAGQPLPPVLFHITPLPFDLIVSPRDQIQQDVAISLLPNLSIEQQVLLESQVDEGMNVSSLVVPVGGIGTYPTMVMRTTALDWLTDTISHEWIHNWLAFTPLGFNYETSPELRTMNETTASIAGREIGTTLMRTYYPELAAEINPRGVNLPTVPTASTFNFNAEMHQTRVHVDELLEQGNIGQAEEYMEQRRQFFWQNGYAIRKLNQAYFAFYGAYADVPGGASGEDPVGPAVRALRAHSPDLASFLRAISRMDTFQDLQAAISP